MNEKELVFTAISIVLMSLFDVILGSIAVICIAKCAMYFNNLWILFLMIIPLALCVSKPNASRKKSD